MLDHHKTKKEISIIYFSFYFADFNRKLSYYVKVLVCGCKYLYLACVWSVSKVTRLSSVPVFALASFLFLKECALI